MSSSSRRRRSISKQRGAEMSSRLIPPKPGATALTVRTISSTSFVARQIGNASTPPNSLNSIALPSITGMAASGPMSPRPGPLGGLGDREAHAGDTGCVRHGEVVARADGRLRDHLDLAAEMEQERAV